MQFSVIIPAFNEEERIGKTLESVSKYLQDKKGYTYEIIVVDDGSEDSTCDLVENLQKQMPTLRLVRLLRNTGKGAAVKEGMLSAQGNIRLFMDADGSTSIVEVDKMLPCLSDGFDIVIGSRHVLGAVKVTRQNILREFLGWIFRILTRNIVRIEVQDPQNGFKLFSADSSRRIFSELKTLAWCFDVEVVVLAQRHGYKIKEIPITWVNDGRSKMRFVDMIRMLIDLLRIRSTYR